MHRYIGGRYYIIVNLTNNYTETFNNMNKRIFNALRKVAAYDPPPALQREYDTNFKHFRNLTDEYHARRKSDPDIHTYDIERPSVFLTLAHPARRLWPAQISDVLLGRARNIQAADYANNVVYDDEFFLKHKRWRSTAATRAAVKAHLKAYGEAKHRNRRGNMYGSYEALPVYDGPPLTPQEGVRLREAENSMLGYNQNTNGNRYSGIG